MKKIVFLICMSLVSLSGYCQSNKNTFNVKNLFINEKVKEEYLKKCSTDGGVKNNELNLVFCVYYDSILNVNSLYVEVFSSKNDAFIRKAVLIIPTAATKDNKVSERDQWNFYQTIPNLYSDLTGLISEKVNLKPTIDFNFEGPLFAWYKQSGTIETDIKSRCQGVPQIASNLEVCSNQAMGNFMTLTESICGKRRYVVNKQSCVKGDIDIKLEKRFTKDLFLIQKIFNAEVDRSNWNNNYVTLSYYDKDVKNTMLIFVQNLGYPDLESTYANNQNSSGNKKPVVNKKDF